MRRYTILHTIEGGGPGGAETVLLQLASQVDPGRFRSLALLSSEKWLRQQLVKRGIETALVDSRAWYDFRLPKAMAKLIRQEKVDLIHSHLPDQNFYSCLVGRLTGTKTIVTYHGAPRLSRGNRFRRGVKSCVVRHSAAAVVVVSDYLRTLFEAAGFPAEKIVRIYNGVDVDRFSQPQEGGVRAELGLGANTKLVGMVANLRQSKGYEYFIRAARQITDCIPEARCVAVGELDKTIAGRMRELIRQLNLEERFFLLGFRSDIPQILGDLNVFVLSSTDEGLSIATIEAMAAGKPVVVTRSGGPEEIVQDGETGFLVPSADPQALATRVCEILRYPGLGAQLGARARSEVERRFTLSKMISEYEALYARCLEAN
ncbi:MAG: glycosyltransferase family 4 protein [Acidobacteriia bacterium]|nr:glycosyltransferase family 4 protein [Terriglobia bacterium]